MPGFILSVWLNMQALKLQYGDFRSKETRKSILSALEDHSRRSLLRLTEHVDQVDVNKDGTNKNEDSVMDYAKIVWDVAAQNTKAPIAHEMIVLFMVVVWSAVLSIISFGESFSPRIRELIVGVTVNLNLVFFYGAPCKYFRNPRNPIFCIHFLSLNF